MGRAYGMCRQVDPRYPRIRHDSISIEASTRACASCPIQWLLQPKKRLRKSTFVMPTLLAE
jgi:hypothetical protein